MSKPVTMTKQEFAENSKAAVDQAMSGTMVHIVDDDGRIGMSLCSLGGDEEDERERLRDAVVEAALRFRRAEKAVMAARRQDDRDVLCNALIERNAAHLALRRAADALEAHERGGGT